MDQHQTTHIRTFADRRRRFLDALHKGLAAQPNSTQARRASRACEDKLLQDFDLAALSAFAADAPVKARLMDALHWRGMARNDPMLRTAMQGADKHHAVSPALAEAVYQYFLNGAAEPQPNGASEWPDAQRLLKALGKLGQVDEVRGLLERTKDDYVAAHLAARRTLEAAACAYAEVQEEEAAEEDQQQDNGPQGPSDGLAGMAAEAAQSAGEDLDNKDKAESLLGPAPKRPPEDGDGDDGEGPGAGGTGDDSDDGDDEGPGDSGDDGEDGDEDDEPLGAPGQGHQAGRPGEMDPASYLTLAEQLMAVDMSAIDLVGRMERHFQAVEEAQVRGTLGRKREYHLGDDLVKIPQHAIYELAVDGLDDLLLQALICGEAPQVTERANAPAGKGPVYLVVDDSGSMLTNNAPAARTVARALALAIAKRVVKQRRRCWGQVYAHNPAWREFDLRQPEALVAFARYTIHGGGTDTCAAIERAVTSLEKVPPAERYRQGSADILLITDGEDYDPVPDDLKQRMERLGCRVYTIFIGGSEGGGQGFAREVAAAFHQVKLPVKPETLAAAADDFWMSTLVPAA